MEPNKTTVIGIYDIEPLELEELAIQKESQTVIRIKKDFTNALKQNQATELLVEPKTKIKQLERYLSSKLPKGISYSILKEPLEQPIYHLKEIIQTETPLIIYAPGIDFLKETFPSLTSTNQEALLELLDRKKQDLVLEKIASEIHTLQSLNPNSKIILLNAEIKDYDWIVKKFLYTYNKLLRKRWNKENIIYIDRESIALQNKKLIKK